MSSTTITPTTITLPRKAVYAAGATGLLAAGALAATLVLRGPQPQADRALVEAAKAPATVAPRNLAAAAGSRPAQAPAGDAPVALATRQAADVPEVCTVCGTVEAVNAVRQKGEASGVGAVAGGVLGGVVGNQMGKGNGRKAMTVLGAVGGGLAGHEIEKRQRATTVYKVTVRMDDGSTRSFTRNESWSVGRRVTVDGSTLRTMRSPAPPHDSAPRTLHTAAPA